MEELKGVHYDAFISYRHSELDTYVAEKILKKLEKFRLPKSVRAKVKNGKTRIERVFRDVDELPLSDNLSDPINNALANSDFLITICTPRYLESKWCMKEIKEFLKTHDREHVLVVLAEDEPCNSFPEILTYEEIVQTDPEGNTVVSRREIEPLAADTRGRNRKEISKAIDIAVIKLCAEIFGLNYDDLRQRQRRQKIQRMILVFSAIGAALLIFAVFATVTLIKLKNLNDTITEQYEDLQKKNITIASQNAELEDNNKTISSQYKALEEKSETIASQNQELEENNKIIAEQYSELQDRYASSMSLVAENLIGAGRKKDAAYVLKNVLVDSESYNSDAVRELYSVMDTYKIEEKYSPEAVFDDTCFYSLSYDGSYVGICSSDAVRVFDTQSGEIVKELMDDSYYDIAFCGTSGIISFTSDGVQYDSLTEDKRIKLDTLINYELIYNAISIEDGSITLLISANKIFAFDNDGQLRYTVALDDIFDNDDANAYDIGNADGDGGYKVSENYAEGSEEIDGEEIDEEVLSYGMEEDEEDDFWFDDEEDDFWFDDTSNYSLVDYCYDKGRILLCLNDFYYHYFLVIDENNGSIVSAFKENMSGEVNVLLEGDVIYYTWVHDVTYGLKTETYTTFLAYNMLMNAYMFDPRPFNKFTINDILSNSSSIFLYDNNMVVVLDKNNGDPLNIYSTVSNIIYGWIMNDKLYYLFDNGALYMCDDIWMYDKSEEYLAHIPSGIKISDAYFVNDDLYCLVDYEYLVRYSRNLKTDVVDLDKEYEIEQDITSIPTDFDKRFNDQSFTEEVILSARFSDDEKLILAECDNSIYKILDAESGETLHVFNNISLDAHDRDYAYMSISYSKLFGGYALHTMTHSYIFDNAFRIICVLPRIVDESDDRLILFDEKGAGKGKEYSVPYVSPDELVRQASNELEGYEPSERIKQEYNIKK